MKTIWYSMAVTIAITCSASGDVDKNRPNILFVLADDWGCALPRSLKP